MKQFYLVNLVSYQLFVIVTVLIVLYYAYDFVQSDDVKYKFNQIILSNLLT